MVDADRLYRYHAEQASKFASQQRWSERGIAVLGVVVAVASLWLTESSFMQTIAVATAIGTSCVAFLRPGKRSLEAVSCTHQLGDLFEEWQILWRRMESGGMDDKAVDQVLRSLALRTNQVTAPLAQERIDRKILATTERETYEYWKKMAGSKSESRDTGKAVTSRSEAAVATT